jgi:hypothetical protein
MSDICANSVGPLPFFNLVLIGSRKEMRIAPAKNDRRKMAAQIAILSGGKVYDTQRIKLSSNLKTLTITIRTAGRTDPNDLPVRTAIGDRW